MKIFPQSIRWRVQLWYALLLAVIVGALLVAFHRNQREIKYQVVDRELTSPITRLLPRMEKRRQPMPRNRRLPRPGGGPGGGQGPRDEFDGPRDRPNERFDDRAEDRGIELEELIAELAGKDIYVIQWSREEEVRYSSDNVPLEGRPYPRVETKGGEQIFKRTLDGYREVIHAGPPGEIVILGRSIAPLEEELSSLALRLVLAGVAIVGGGFLVGWFLIGRSLKPIARIGSTAHRIAGGDLSDRIEIRGRGSELGQLSQVLNETFDQLESSFEHQVRFTADASHEMRTPIAVILAKSQFALNRERSPEKYQECLRTCMESAQHMRALTDALLELSKVDSGEFRLRAEAGNPSELVREVVQMIEPLADEKKITIRCDLDEVTAVFDAQKIRQALLNLLSNAVKYNREEGEIEVSLKETPGEVVLTIRDTGPGIGEDALPHLFDRFYRVDRARTQTRDGRGGTGLGLAITKAIIEGHGGAIKATSEVGVGSVFEVRLPREGR